MSKRIGPESVRVEVTFQVFARRSSMFGTWRRWNNSNLYV